MNRFEEKFQKISKPDLDFPHNQRALRQVLLKKIENRSNPLLTMFFKKLLPTGLALALILVVGPNLFPNNQIVIPPVSAAEQMVNNVLEKIKHLTPEEINEINQKMGLETSPEENGFIELLKEAKAAPDLKLVEPMKFSCEEFREMEKNKVSNPELTQVSIKFESTFAGISDGSEESNELLYPFSLENENCKTVLKFSFENDNNITNYIDADLDNDGQPNMNFIEYTKGDIQRIIGIDSENLPSIAFDIDQDSFKAPLDALNSSQDSAEMTVTISKP